MVLKKIVKRAKFIGAALLGAMLATVVVAGTHASEATGQAPAQQVPSAGANAQVGRGGGARALWSTRAADAGVRSKRPEAVSRPKSQQDVASIESSRTS